MQFTIDTNCVIDLEMQSEHAAALMALVAAHHVGRANVAIPAIAASEVQKGNTYLETFGQFEERLRLAGLDSLQLVHPISYYGIGFFGMGYLADEPMVALDKQLQAILHPDIAFGLKEYCEEHALPFDSIHPDRRWRNARCDTQAMWSHIHHQRECFVTRDKNFLKATKVPKLLTLGAQRILLPRDAAALLSSAA